MELYLSTMPFKPSKLEPWQLEDAQRVNRLYKLHAPKGMSQEEFGAKFGIGSQGMVWQYLNAKRPLNVKAAAAFARGLSMELAEISPKLAALVDTVNDNPHLRELVEECADLDVEQIKTLKIMAAALRGATPARKAK